MKFISNFYVSCSCVCRYLMLLYGYIFNSIHNLVFPPYCTYCKKFLMTHKVMCTQCSAMIQPVVSTTITITKKHSMKVFAIADYKEPLKSLILAKGWSDIFASRCLGELIWDMTTVQYQDFDYIIPVPLHWTRYAWRGYNQAEEIARILSKKSKKPITKILERNKRTAFQSNLSSEDRIKNVHKAFTLKTKNINQYSGKRLVLVDDLMTTHATLQSAARVLLTVKPASLIAVVACRVV